MATDSSTPKVYGYRWVVLAVFFLITLAIGIQWLTFAPIAREARVVYGATALQIDILSLLFLVMYLVVCLPASHVIDRYGVRIGIGIGAVLTGVFGLMKGFFPHAYWVQFACQAGLGIAQPFILNAGTKVAVKWFPLGERATAVGLATMAQFAGFIIVNMATPFLVVQSGDSFDLQRMLLTWGVISAAIAVAFLALMREEPPTPPGDDRRERLMSLEGLKHIFRQRDMILTTTLFFIGLGLFNAIATCIDQVCEAKGLTPEQSGMIMGTMLIGAIPGAVVMPLLSDRLRRRKAFIVAAVALLIPGLAGMTVFTDYGLLLVSSGAMGFFLLGGAGPIGFQYAAEVSRPAPESLSQGLMLLAGQVSGILFVVGMNLAGMIPFMWVFLALSGVNIIISLLLRESPMMRPDRR